MWNKTKLSAHWRADGTGSDPDGPVRSSRGRWLARGGSVLGLGLIALWIGSWIVSYKQNHMVLPHDTWVPVLPFIAGDFVVHIDHVARIQAAGVDPYHKFDDWVCGLYPYPPMIGRIFFWVVPFSTATAAFLWQAALGLIMAGAGVAIWRFRRELGLDRLPLLMIIAALLFSTPFVFAAERGQCDPMIIVALIVAAGLFRKQENSADLMAGALLGVTAWIKYYPGLAVVAPLVMGRKRAVIAFAVVAGAIGMHDFDGFRESVKRGQAVQKLMDRDIHPVHPATHAIIGNWHLIHMVRQSPLLQKVPPTAVAVVLLVPAVALVTWRFSRSRNREAMALPFMLWLASAATFGLPYSNDYNLATLPVAALMVWDRRDRWPVHLAILLSMLWSQPFLLPISGEILLVVKFLGLYGVGASLAARATQIAQPEQSWAEHSMRVLRPNFPLSTAARNAFLAESVCPQCQESLLQALDAVDGTAKRSA